MSKLRPDNLKSASIICLLARALLRIRSTPPRIIASPPTQPRRAAVAIIIRVVPAPTSLCPQKISESLSLSEIFQLDWVNHPEARPEILFLCRDHPAIDDVSQTQPRLRSYNSAKEAHVAFPGGRTAPEDEGGLYTAMRQTWDEIGVDLAECHYTCVGQLDDREITTSLGKRLLMILSPFVFLQLTPYAPSPDPIPSVTTHWVPLSSLVFPGSPKKWTTVSVDAASRLAPKNSTALRLLVRLLVGTMEYPAIMLPPSSDPPLPSFHDSGKKSDSVEKGIYKSPKNLKLWGLSLGMVLDLISYMISPFPDNPLDSSAGSPSPLSSSIMQLPYQLESDTLRMDIVAPSLASVFPRFSYPDVNFWIWVFGKRYREVVRGWEASVRSGGINDRRINWSGSALNTLYAAIRKALIIVIVARALGIILGIAIAIWWIFRN